jgi:hypothetical protein
VNSIASELQRRSAAFVGSVDRGHRQLLAWWTIAASLACGVRLSTASFPSLPLQAQLASALPYVLVVGAPIVSFLLALRWFRDGDRMPQPRFRLARYGRWHNVRREEARSLPLYGVTGIMASLILGMLTNIPVRTLEFLAAMPALGAAPPAWFGSLYLLMLVDVVMLSSLYAVAAVAALRHVPLFPRMVALIWGADILMQLVIAQVITGVPDLPPAVAVALHPLLEGNIDKVLISVALWAPYLLLSKRVNLTFRRRIPASAD